MGRVTAIFPVLMAGAALATAACGSSVARVDAAVAPPAHALAASTPPPSAPETSSSPPRIDATATAAPALAAAPREEASEAEAQSSVRAKAAPDGAAPRVSGTAVLHIGDSFAVAGFAQALRPRMQALGVRYEVRAETSSFTTSWAGKMEKVVADTQPDLVIINLGANEVSNTDPTTHAPHVRRIVKAIGGRPCVWVSPPLWRKDTGITEVIRENSAPCRFFDSDALVKRPIPRQSDHIHPNEAGGAIWAEAFWSWLGAERALAGDSGDLLPVPLPVPRPKPSAASLLPSPWRLKPAPPGEHQAP